MRNSDRRGFTLVELLISLTVGLVIVAASLSFAISTFSGVEANKLREEVFRNGRFIGMSLTRDVQTAGVGIESIPSFGTLHAFSDSLVVLRVPFEPSLAPAHELRPPPGSPNPLPFGGTCGALCLDLEYDASGGFDLQPGDLARLQSSTERRLLLITGVRDMGTYFQITFLGDTEILDHQAAFAGGLQMDRSGTSVQELQPIVYFVEDSVLYRAQSFDASGNLEESPMAYGVTDWQTFLLFTDGDTATAGDATDADNTNDFDDLLGTLVRATVETTRRDIRVADGGIFSREFEWTIMPRNLAYERNR